MSGSVRKGVCSLTGYQGPQDDAPPDGEEVMTRTTAFSPGQLSLSCVLTDTAFSLSHGVGSDCNCTGITTLFIS